MDRTGGKRRRGNAAQSDKAGGGAEEDPADCEDRGRDKGRDRQHAFARQPRRPPLREGAPGPLRPAEMEYGGGESAGGEDESDREGGEPEPGMRRQQIEGH